MKKKKKTTTQIQLAPDQQDHCFAMAIVMTVEMHAQSFNTGRRLSLIEDVLHDMAALYGRVRNEEFNL